ncbi:MAG: hypothetical protein COA79_07460 [Planctomycetota bacterium]|nr:MAG: hypothetical protein COA79_07460 [Planctomycetota bacterium]
MYKDTLGFRQGEVYEDSRIKLGVNLWLERVFGWYGEENPPADIQIIEGQLALTSESADYIYSDFTPLELKYVKGTRPFLEEVLSQIINDDMSDHEKFLAIMRRCRDNRDYKSDSVVFDGGSEEELIKRGAIMCNEISRVFTALSQMAGFPARVIGVHISGHMMSEIYINGKWAFVDSMKGMYCFLDNGDRASFWDLMQDPGIVDRQEASVWEDCRPIGGMGTIDQKKAQMQARLRDCYLYPKEASCIGNYYCWESDKFNYKWTIAAADNDRLEQARIAEARNRIDLGYPPHYSVPISWSEDRPRMK